MTTAHWQKAAESVEIGARCTVICNVHGKHSDDCPLVAAVLPWVEKCEELEARIDHYVMQLELRDEREAELRARADAAEKRCREVAAEMRLGWQPPASAVRLMDWADRLDPRE